MHPFYYCPNRKSYLPIIVFFEAILASTILLNLNQPIIMLIAFYSSQQ